jgi:YihY family inner membrane protein
MAGVKPAIDRWQQRHRTAGFTLAVLRKYSDDQGAYLAATISYYAFFSIFPLLLVLTTVLGFVLDAHGHLYKSVVDSALGQFPVIGHQLRTHSLSGSGLGIAIGIAVSLWAGTSVFLAAQHAMDEVWDVPYTRRPGFLGARLHALGLLGLLGGGILAATILASVATFGSGYGIGWKLGSIALSVVLDIGLFWVGLRLLTAREVSWRSLRGGAIGAGIAYAGLQALGGYYVGHVLESSSETYGTFALVIGLLSWIYLTTHVTLLAAEANVVATRRLWPRSLTKDEPPTEAERRALAESTRAEERREDELIDVDFAENGGRAREHVHERR